MKKYALVPGWITSKNDRQEHFIGAAQLADLYKVKMSECVVVQSDEDLEMVKRKGELVLLGPRYHGDYSLPDKEKA